ncbi:MAG TPA: S1 RNA-binding domain-containing protein [Candidatus Limnocylindrales bacterium]|nr:S1 RNA-binding domain-containing protein [Candidatus Limnocylindrales bacterium]
MADSLDFRALLEASFSENLNLKKGEIRKGTILQVGDREVIVDLGAKLDGVVPSTDLERLDPSVRDGLKVGQLVPVYILNPGGQDETLIVSINMGLQQYDWEKARELMTSEEPTKVVVKGHNRGGILVHWERLEGFIPSSHLVTTAGTGGRESWDELLSTDLVVKVIEVDQARRRLIFSEREAQREQRAMHKARLLAELNEGDKVRGRVTGLRDFGAFVNLGGADGLIHVSELAWHRVDHPRDVLKVGDEIEVYVLSLDRSSNRIALSRKRLLQDPWETASEVYHEGQLIEGTVTNVVDFGAFVALDNGLEGLLHLSEMGDGSLKEPYSYLKKGDRLQLRISHLEPEKRRVGFTQRWGTEAAQAAPASAPVAEEAAPESVADETPADEAAPVPEQVEDAASAEVVEVVEDVAAEVKEEAPAAVIVEETAEAEAPAAEAADDATTMMAVPPKGEES